MFSAFGDLTTNAEANKEACKFIRSTIDQTVKNPQKAKVLNPYDIYARHSFCDIEYYQIFNRDNVDIVDLRGTPIENIVLEGIKTKNGAIHKS